MLSRPLKNADRAKYSVVFHAHLGGLPGYGMSWNALKATMNESLGQFLWVDLLSEPQPVSLLLVGEPSKM